jgi:chromosome segregation protein
VFLKSLTMKGFKSFADTTVLEFEPGVTVVVGPNGSGKSNVVDAVAWVLGAQGPTTVRSGKMEDVVFAGTSDRPALGRAEVSLVIDNSSRSLPIEFSEIKVTRTLYRSGDSEYSMNGVPCRLLDIQELLSDAGVGRQQHVIVAQGQIEQVLNARPEDRRMIIEEAAGVLKFRRRKERAERRLAATEANVTRLQDLQREVRRQLRPLEKQADAAKRHGDVVEELRTLRLYLTGKKLKALEAAQSSAKEQSRDLDAEQVRLRGELAGLDIEIGASEAQLAEGGDQGLDLLPRVESLRERCRGLIALVNERSRTTERDRGLLVAEDVALTLKAELSRLATELIAFNNRDGVIERQLEELALVEAELDIEGRSLDDEAPLVGLDAAKRAAEVRGELGPLRAGVERVVAEHDGLAPRVNQVASQIRDADRRLDELQSRLSSASGAEADRVQLVDKDQGEVDNAVGAIDALTEEQQLALKEEGAWRARADALELAIEDARARSGLQKIEEIEGVLGVLGELIQVESGWEPAVEAAIGGALASVVVEDVQTARIALQRLRESDSAGSILALKAPNPTLGLPNIGQPLRHRVSTRHAAIDPLLDVLLEDAVCVSGDWSEAIDLAVEQPGLTVVTATGDCCGPNGWSVGSGENAATAAALEDAKDGVREATARREAAEVARTSAESAHREARHRLEIALVELEANDDLLTRSSDAIERIQRERRDLTSERGVLEARTAELGQVLDRDRPRLVDLEAQLVELEVAENLERSAATATHTKRRDLGDRIRVAATKRAEFEASASFLGEQKTRVEARHAEISTQLEANDEEREGSSGRLNRVGLILAALAQLRELLQARLDSLEQEVGRLREQRTQISAEVRLAADRLELLRGERTAIEKRAAEIRELAASGDITETERRFKLDSLREMLRNELSAGLDEAMAVPEPQVGEADTPASRVRELESDLRRMGPINPLAMQEYESLEERHDFVAEQLQDVRNGRRELNKVIAAVDAEIVEVFSSAFTDVAENFEQIFSTLFPGGEGRLKLTDPNQMLEAGIELEAKPSGKNVRKLSLLSGGERSLTALAFLFAIFRSRPSPFYVLDEVEAALDDINLHRFLDLVSEFRQEAQLVIVSHQKRTMEVADVLYGVSMAPSGSSRVLSEKVSS